MAVTLNQRKAREGNRNLDFHRTPSSLAPQPKTAGEEVMGSAKRKNVRLRRLVKSGACMACGAVNGPYTVIDPCHVRSFKVSQNDADWNLVTLCRQHHAMQHQHGWMYLIVIYSNLRFEIESRGWVFDKLPDGSWKMSNEKEVALNESRRANG